MDDRIKGVMLMLMGTLWFSLSSAAAKFTIGVPVAEKLFVRNSFAALIAFLLMIKKRERLQGNNRKLLFLRGAVGFFGALFYLYSINHLPLSDATLLNKVSPFFTIIASAIFLKEKIRKHHVLVLVLGLTGAVFILKPGLEYNLLAACLGLVSALSSGISYTIIRHLRITDTPNMILLYFSVVSAIASVPVMLWGSFKIPTGAEIWGLLLMGLFTAFSQLSVNYAYRYASAVDLSVFDYATIIFSTIIGLVIWKEVPGIMSIMGTFLIIIAGIINYRADKDIHRLDMPLDQ